LWERLAHLLRVDGVIMPPDELHTRYDHLVEADRHEHGEPFVLDSHFWTNLFHSDSHSLPAATVTELARRFRELSTTEIRVRDYAFPLLTSLRQSGCRTALVSNTEASVTDHDLDTTGLRPHFDAVVLSSAVGVKKPDPAIFRFALSQLAIPAECAAHIGDDYHADVEGARSAGIRPILIQSKDVRSTTAISPTLDALSIALTSMGARLELG
jgi:HAD superfamily hydrolase (TIGR01509 family)